MMLLSRAARAQAPDEIVVVEVDPSAAALDVAKLRAAVGEELHATAVAPEDPRAGSARGTLRVETSDAKHAMRITFIARATPTVRTIALPTDPHTARREAVLVAGNLARDEGADLARELRKKKQSEPTPRPDPERPAGSRLNVRALLEYHAAQERTGRRALFYGALGVSAAGIGIGAAVWANGDRPRGTSVMAISLGAAAYSGIVYALMPDPPFEAVLAAADRNGLELDQTWAKAAAEERRARRGGAISALVAGGLAAGVGTWALLDDKTWGANRTADGPLLLGLGAAAVLGGVYALATEGPVEDALHAYEKAIGQPVAAPSPTASARVTVAPVVGGAIVGLSGAF